MQIVPNLSQTPILGINPLWSPDLFSIIDGTYDISNVVPTNTSPTTLINSTTGLPWFTTVPTYGKIRYPPISPTNHSYSYFTGFTTFVNLTLTGTITRYVVNSGGVGVSEDPTTASVVSTHGSYYPSDSDGGPTTVTITSSLLSSPIVYTVVSGDLTATNSFTHTFDNLVTGLYNITIESEWSASRYVDHSVYNYDNEILVFPPPNPAPITLSLDTFMTISLSRSDSLTVDGG